MIKTSASCRSLIAGLIVLYLTSPMEWRAPHDDLINRPILNCYGGRSACAERMSWLAPVSAAAARIEAIDE